MTTINTTAKGSVHAAIDYLHRRLSKDGPVPKSLLEPVTHLHGTTPLARAFLDRLAMRELHRAAPEAREPLHVGELLPNRGGRNARNLSARRLLAWLRDRRAAAV